MLFGGSNHVEKGGDLLNVEDPRVANHNGKRFASAGSGSFGEEGGYGFHHTIGVARGSGEYGHGTNEIKMTSKTVISSSGRSDGSYIRV